MGRKAAHASFSVPPLLKKQNALRLKALRIKNTERRIFLEKDNELLLLLVLIFTPIVIFAVVRIIISIARFKKEGQYIAMEMRRSYENDEYNFWKRELRCHYLRLIPFVTKNNVGTLYKKLFKKSSTSRSDGIFHLFAPPILAIGLCAVCLCGATFAWFTASNTSNVAPITAATYEISVNIEKDGKALEASEPTGGVFKADLSEGEYTVTLSADGTAETGFGIINISGEKARHTEQITKASPLTFKITTDSKISLTIESNWGTSTAKDKLNNNDTLTFKAPAKTEAEEENAGEETEENTEIKTEENAEENAEEAEDENEGEETEVNDAVEVEEKKEEKEEEIRETTQVKGEE